MTMELKSYNMKYIQHKNVAQYVISNIMRHSSQNDHVESQELKKLQDRLCHKKICIPVLEPGF